MNNDVKTDILLLKEKSELLSVLYVEDEELLREKVYVFLQKFFKLVDVAIDGKEGLEKYKLNRYDIVITDIQMPNMNGIDLIKQIKSIDDNQEVIVMSAYSDSEYFVESIQLEVTGYIIKPINFNKMLKVLKQSINKLNAFHENEMYKAGLEVMVKERSKTVIDLQSEQLKNYKHAIYSLVKMVEARDTYTGGHSERVAQYSRIIAKKMGFSEDECTLIYEAGILHDIGKIITPDAILLKPGQLSVYEYALIKDHVSAGYKILSEIPMYEKLADIVYGHHEHYDGSGYPRGIKGDDISIMSRIMMVADAFDAMTTSRVYRARKSVAEAIEELESLSGTWYDPNVITHAVSVLSLIDIDKNIKQMPSSIIDDERFAYFYKDPLTSSYNQNYLDFLLNMNSQEKKELYINIFYIRRFSLYNKNNSWSDGDEILKGFSSYLRSEFPDSQVFRIFGDDFVLLGDKKPHIDLVKVNSTPLLKENNLYCDTREFSLINDKIKSYIDLEE